MTRYTLATLAVLALMVVSFVYVKSKKENTPAAETPPASSLPFSTPMVDPLNVVPALTPVEATVEDDAWAHAPEGHAPTSFEAAIRHAADVCGIEGDLVIDCEEPPCIVGFVGLRDGERLECDEIHELSRVPQRMTKIRIPDCRNDTLLALVYDWRNNGRGGDREARIESLKQMADCGEE